MPATIFGRTGTVDACESGLQWITIITRNITAFRVFVFFIFNFGKC
jgi:hypothetical protein